MTRLVGSLDSLPDHAFGHRTLIWWGVIGFILIEGTVFALAGGAYLFLVGHTRPWPPFDLSPSLLWGTAFTALALLSEAPNVWTDKKAHAYDPGKTRLGLIVMCAMGGLLLAVRFLEFGSLNVRWEENAYGSVVWALMILHTVHVITDLADTVVLTVFSHTHELDAHRFADVGDNCLYWHFVVLAWLPIYALVYWAPRLIP